MSGLPLIQQGLYPPSSEGKRDARNALMCAPQSLLLQHDDDGDQGAIENHCYAEYKEKKLEGVTGNYKDKV